MEAFVGQIQAFGFNFAPRGWASCNGQLISISQNTALFSLLGTMYGGDGTTTLALPDLRGRSIVGIGQGPGLSDIRQGERAGVESVTLLVSNLPAHNHSVTIGVSTATGEESNPQNKVLASHPDAYNTVATPNASLNSGSTSSVGSSSPFGIRNPYLGINICIAMQGIYPSRN